MTYETKVAEQMVARLMERLTASRTFKVPAQMETYRECRRASADMGSFLYDRDRRDNLINEAYWSGRNGRPSKYTYRSLRYAAWAAGHDELKQADRYAAEMAISLRNAGK
jgi:hypothetical protein